MTPLQRRCRDGLKVGAESGRNLAFGPTSANIDLQESCAGAELAAPMATSYEAPDGCSTESNRIWPIGKLFFLRACRMALFCFPLRAMRGPRVPASTYCVSEQHNSFFCFVFSRPAAWARRSRRPRTAFNGHAHEDGESAPRARLCINLARLCLVGGVRLWRAKSGAADSCDGWSCKHVRNSCTSKASAALLGMARMSSILRIRPHHEATWVECLSCSAAEDSCDEHGFHGLPCIAALCAQLPWVLRPRCFVALCLYRIVTPSLSEGSLRHILPGSDSKWSMPVSFVATRRPSTTPQCPPRSHVRRAPGKKAYRRQLATLSGRPHMQRECACATNLHGHETLARRATHAHRAPQSNGRRGGPAGLRGRSRRTR